MVYIQFVQGAIVNGFVSLVVSTLEKRFNINSAQSGNIGGSYDIGFMLAIIPMTYFGGKRGASKPRYCKLFAWRLFIISIILFPKSVSNIFGLHILHIMI